MAKKPVPQPEKPKHDDAKYGDVLYSFSYDMDDMNFFNAMSLVGSGRLQQFFPPISMVLLLIIIMSLYDREHPIYPLAVAAFVGFIALSTVVNKWTSIRSWYVSKSTLDQPGSLDRHVVVTAQEIVVEGPDDMVTTYPLSEIKKVSQDEDGALVKLGKRRYVYIPQKALSDSRYTALIKLLRSSK